MEKDYLQKYQRNNILKVDLDNKCLNKTKKHLIERLSFLNKLKIVPIEYIDKIKVIKKSSYSCKIILNKTITNYNILIFQSILGDDFKRTSISFRDLIIENKIFWNKLFDIKRYRSGEYIKGKYRDITKEIKEKIINN